MTEIRLLRLSFVYVETFLDLVTGKLAQAEAPYDFLAHRFAYVNRFAQSVAGAGSGGDLEPPWPRTRGKAFWSFYFGGDKALGDITAEEAWRGITPLRQRLQLTVSTAADGRRVGVDAFVYPHGVAAILGLSLAADFTPEQLARRALEVRRQPIYSTSAGEVGLTLDALAARILDATRTIAFGAQTAGRRPPFPFSVATVILGGGVESEKPVAENGPEHRLLQVISAWPPAWQAAGTPPLADVTLPLRKGTPAGHLLYAGDRGRAVWLPGLFCLAPGEVRSLGCFHRNLVFASMQVDSLAHFASITQRMLEAGTPLSPDHRDLAFRAVSVLGRFYGGAASIYRSRSPRAQIERASWRTDIDSLRAQLGQGPLHAAVP